MDILFFLLLAHLAGDYALQSDKMAENKKSIIGSLSLHVAVYVIVIWLFILSYSVLYQPGLYAKSSTLLFLLILYVQHWTQDYIKGRIPKSTKQIYYIDQTIHITVLYLYRIFIYSI